MLSGGKNKSRSISRKFRKINPKSKVKTKGTRTKNWRRKRGQCAIEDWNVGVLVAINKTKLESLRRQIFLTKQLSRLKVFRRTTQITLCHLNQYQFTFNLSSSTFLCRRICLIITAHLKSRSSIKSLKIST